MATFADGVRPPVHQPAGVPGSRDWSAQLAPRLLAPPARWGWRPPDPVAPAPLQQRLPDPPRWTEPPAVDTTRLRTARSRAVTSLVRRVLLAAALVALLVLAGAEIDRVLGEWSGSARTAFGTGALVALGLLLIGILVALVRIGRRSGEIARFERPYRAQLDADRRRHADAVARWEQARREHEAAVARVAQQIDAAERGPHWFPVHPRTEPVRVDVLGGDPRRHGWASLLATAGTSAVAAGMPVTVLDLTGLDVATGLVGVAAAAGYPTATVRLLPEQAGDLLVGLDRTRLLTCLPDALVAPGPDRREEHALVSEVLRGVLGVLDDPVTLPRVAAAVGVLRQAGPDERLSPAETRRLIETQVAGLGQGEWVQRRLRLLGSQLGMLVPAVEGAAPGASGLWRQAPVSLIATTGGRSDAAVLLDRLLVRVAQDAIEGGLLSGLVVLAGADELDLELLLSFAERARRHQVRLMLMIAHPPPELHRFVGNGGAVCFMTMYNHVDANLAAEFIGRGHRFVLSQLSVNVGRSFSDTGGDSFSAATNESTSANRGGRTTGMSDSRGHTWTGTRGWGTSDSFGSSESSSRVYEFVVEPTQIMQMPQTAFILVDSTGPSRRIVMADANPGICLLDRVATQDRSTP